MNIDRNAGPARAVIDILLACCGLTLLLAQAAVAQQYPAKPVRVLTYSSAGSGTDRLLRVMADELSKAWGQTALVENRPGASGIIVAEACAKAAPDGYTICMLDRGQLSMLPHLYKSLPYDAKDFDPVTNVAYLISVLAAGPGVPAETISQLISLAREKPGTVNYGSLGIGTPPHLVIEWINKKYGVNLVHVPYKAPPALVQALVANEIQLTSFGLMNLLGPIRGGKAKALAVSGTKRTPLLPNVPTMTEAGLAGLDDQIWFGLFVPAGTPAQITMRINRDVVRVFSDPGFRERNMVSQGWEPILDSPESFSKLVKADREVGGELVRISGARLE